MREAPLLLFYRLLWRRKWQPTPVFLPGESQGWQNLGCRLWVVQSRTCLKRLSSSSSSGYGELAVLCYMRVTSQLMNAGKPVIWTQPSVLRVSAVTCLVDKPGSTHTEMWTTTRNYTSDMDKDYLHYKKTAYKILCVLWFHFSPKGKYAFELGKRLKSVHPEMLTVTFFARWMTGMFLFSFLCVWPTASEARPLGRTTPPLAPCSQEHLWGVSLD